MTCRTIGAAIVCGPPPGIYRRLERKCWTCETEHRFVQTWDGAYYGTTLYGLDCGDIWSDGERAERPFSRYWKRDRIAQAQRMWDQAISDEAWEAYTRADVQWVCANTKKEERAAEAAMKHAKELIGKGAAA